MAAVLQSQKTALITGAASGIGFAVAKLCRSRGMHLALLDVDEANLAKAKEVLASTDSSSSLKTEAYNIDVGDKSQWDNVASHIRLTFPTVDLVLLNAARGTKPKDSNPWIDNAEYWRTIFDTNVFGPINGISALLPLLKNDTLPKSIVITGSKQGITNPPGARNPAYNASKGAIKILAEHLAHDLRSDPATAHISAHMLVPGWTFTGLSGNVGPTSESEVQKPQGAWLSSQVADELEKALQRGSFYIICPDDETDRALDKARMQWGADDIIEDRPALSRWEKGWKAKAENAIQEDAERRRGA
ncbi:Putative Short chain dehydrogenase/reductase (AFU_orthologue; AFUA_2G00830) [Aspergillus calidoustus]|uniref:Putative Short chain dehydrogenase/reductase (AFU_orthologue AFUA_2G00830) n=1 Tax=Aspergillus calidoustus TaxID=454130 RepID=A0A0U5CLR8_ASPCI|nr:Putative Short chain dehydrogenase/reductase (AFU_orthologue; AFUA_2G00830) [Aspergillus calidoustus]